MLHCHEHTRSSVWIVNSECACCLALAVPVSVCFGENAHHCVRSLEKSTSDFS